MTATIGTMSKLRTNGRGDAKPGRLEVRTFEPGAADAEFDAMLQAFPPKHFAQLLKSGFRFYRTTFWYPFDREPENVFEAVVNRLTALADPSANVSGVEWWFSVLLTNMTPEWLLPCHFDRDVLTGKKPEEAIHPECASVLFLNEVPYGELVITDQVLTKGGITPRRAQKMRFIPPRRNLYVVFPGHLYHGVIGRMWRPRIASALRISMAVNYWAQKPGAEYLRDSRDCLDAFQLQT